MPLLAAVLALAACGKRGDPLPPLKRVPQLVTDLEVKQRGDRLEIALTAPRAFSDGSRLPVLEVEVLRAAGEGDFEKVARPSRRKAAPGERILEEEPLPAQGTKLRFAARARAKGRVSKLTPVATLTVAEAPSAPSGLTTQSDPKGAALAWTPPAVAPVIEADATPVPPTFFVYRRPKAGAYTRPLHATPTTAASFIDPAVTPGEELCFVVRTVTSTRPLVESAPSDESCLLVEDVAPPETPAGVAANGKPGGIEVSWSPSAEPDLVLHRIYRWSTGAPITRIAEVPSPETTYFDTDAPAGVVARYTVTAVDKAGNESERAPGVSASRP
jgi:predicted small lipoprotein YifL